MDNIELYINGNLCDTGKNFGVRLRRQIINPAELNTKDSQMSYSITLPPTPTNNKIFDYASIEETKGKFVKIQEAELIINSHRVFQGNFKLSEISNEGYKGNLVVPVSKTVKDIFGDSKLTQNDPLEIEFKDFTESINYWNTQASKENITYTNQWDGSVMVGKSPCIFPYVLYGLLPKTTSSVDGNTISSRDYWDNSVKIGMQDLPPSVNVLTILKHIFKTKNYTLTGTAFDDVRLNSLYVSYKNETDYVQPWNYGRQAKMHLKGFWSNTRRGDEFSLEKGIYLSYDSVADGRELYTSDILMSTNAINQKVLDSGENINDFMHADQHNNKWYNSQIYIPSTGYYKITLTANLKISGPAYNPDDSPGGANFRFLNADNNTFYQRRFEVKILRDRKTGDFRLSNSRIDGSFDRDNFPQNNILDKNNIPKFYPQITYTTDGKPCQTQFVDLAHNPHFVVGLAWGQKGDRGYAPTNPKDLKHVRAQVMAAKSSFSWSNADNTYANRVGINSPGYWKYGIVEVEDEIEETEGENELDEDVIDWYITDQFKQTIENAPENWAQKISDTEGDGSVSAIVWLEAGELLTLATTSDEARTSTKPSKYGVVNYSVNYDIEVSAFRTQKEWLQVDSSGNGTAPMNWKDTIDFQTDKIDLIKFLPNDVRTDEFIDNFCKAFNLKLSQTGIKDFSLDVKQNKKSQQNNFIDLDISSSVRDKSNQPLGLPSAYSIGFSISEDEEGAQKSASKDGTGIFYTGVLDGSITEQKSNFSYNWFKEIKKQENENEEPITIPLPVISKAEVWTTEMSYSEAMKKRYTNLPQRFWYYDGLLNDLGINLYFGKSDNNKILQLAKVSNSLQNISILSYKNENNTILDNYFTLLIDANSHYTVLECYLLPEQYEAIGNGAKVRFNGDLYYVADIDGYDPLNQNKCTIKLIRMI